MPQDYSPKKTTKKRASNRRAKNTSKTPRWAWSVITLLLVLVVGLLAYVFKLKQPALEVANEEKAKPATKSTSQRQPRFVFYEKLKDQRVEVPDRSNEIKEPAEVKNIDYYLQAGSFRSKADADKMRAKLLLLNLDVRIETATNDKGKTWHRVITGPFSTRSTMARARSTLSSQRIQPLLLKRKRG